MRKFFLCLSILTFAVVARAASNATLFGGYQYTRFDTGSVTSGSSLLFGSGIGANGWNAALTGGFNSWLGLRADVSAAYPNGFSFYTYTVGPELSIHLPIIRPFAHALFGLARATSAGAATNGFDTMIGGGVDLGNGVLAWRLAQFDWMYTRFNGVGDSRNVRICTGLVIRL
ncbi:MAG TPA: hypothetical protein VFA90_07025 [Terriglobales bacterium]|nr:hypothetical protein [Terriglobales bacterium]